jgi:hypothetical protein
VTSPVVQPDTEQTDEPTSSTTTTTVDRCASSRITRPHCGNDDDPTVDDPPATEVEGQTETSTTTPPAVDPVNTVAGGGEAGTPAPEQVLAGEIDRSAPAPEMPAPATLPRTGAHGIGTEVTLAFGLMAAGIAILSAARRRRPATARSRQG